MGKVVCLMNLISGTHKMEGENQFLEAVLWRHTSAHIHEWMHIIHTLQYTQDTAQFTRDTTIYVRCCMIYMRYMYIAQFTRDLQYRHCTRSISEQQRGWGASVLVLRMNPGLYSLIQLTTTGLPMCQNKVSFSFNILDRLYLFFCLSSFCWDVGLFFSISREFFIHLENWLFLCSELQKISPGE